MSKTYHRLFVLTMAMIVIILLVAIIYYGTSYYNTVLEERFYHPDHKALKPSGDWGHGFGIAGSLFMAIGVSSYMLRKRWRKISKLGLLKHWLEFHIFMCTLGPFLVLFHTAFKFGGLVSISFWSMVAVFLSGIIGRFIYIQIPRTIEGRELSLNEVRNMKVDVVGVLKSEYNLSDEVFSSIIKSTNIDKEISPDSGKQSGFITGFFKDFISKQRINNVLKKNGTSKHQRRRILGLINDEITLNRRIARLTTMQNLFKYWHVAHLPFALIMLVIMIIHVIVTIVFGYRWLF